MQALEIRGITRHHTKHIVRFTGSQIACSDFRHRLHGLLEGTPGNKPGIGPGDMFILNDPYRGAIHQPDVSIVAPVFHMGRHVAWAGSCAHQLDVGGMSFGSWAIGATEIQQEAMLLPGIKLVEGGRLREDLWQMIMGMTRLPHILGLDLKAMIAANTVPATTAARTPTRPSATPVEGVTPSARRI